MAYIRWVPKVGFALTATACREFLESDGLRARMANHLDDLGTGFRTPADVAESIHRLFLESPFPAPIAESIRRAYRDLCDRHERDELDVTVWRRSAAEGPPETTSDSLREPAPRVSGEEAVLEACRGCYASLFTAPGINGPSDHGSDGGDMTVWVGPV